MRSRVRRLIGTVRLVVEVAGLLLAARRGDGVDLWLGDSHAVFFNRSWPCPDLSRTAPGTYVWHLGPRLMFSLGRDGFPPSVRRVAGLLSRCGRVRLIAVAGEIDIRCHLAPRLADGDGAHVVARYLDAVTDLADAARATAVVVVPVPPGTDYQDAPGFPIVGSIDQRLAAFDLVRKALHAGALTVLDASDGLAGPDGALAAALTVDGCHVNPAGARIVHAVLAGLA